MNRVDSKRKINFIKSFWMEMLEVNIYRYERNKLSNCNTYLKEISHLIESIKKSNKKVVDKNTFGLYHLLLEFETYLNQDTFFVREYTDEESFVLLIREVKKIVRTKHNQDIKNNIHNLESLINNFEHIQNDNIRKLFNELLKYVYGSMKLEKSYKIFKSLTMDLLVELILDGYPIEYLKKETFKKHSYFSRFPLNQSQSLKHQFEYTRELFVENNRPKIHTFIYRVNNLKTISPFKINEFTFYNPSREDINIHLKSIKTLVEEEGLMKYEEVKNKKNSIDSVDRLYEVIDMRNHTDAHVRVNVTHWNKKKAELQVKEKLKTILVSLRLVYSVTNLSISDSHVYISGARKTYPLYRNDKDPTIDIDYTNFNVLRNKYKDFEDKDSLFYTILASIQNEIQIYNSLESFHLGIDEPSLVNKFHHYWISLESLFSDNESRNIKSRILKKYSNLLVYYYYYFELMDIAHKVFNDFYNYYGKSFKKKLPAEIEEINGLGNYYNNLNLGVFSENLHLFKKYLNDEYLINRIDDYIKLNTNINYRKSFNENLENSYRQKLSKIYNLRNQMFHNAINDNSMLIFYTNWLESLLYAVFGTVEKNMYEGVSNNDYLNINYKDFLYYLKQTDNHIINFYTADN